MTRKEFRVAHNFESFVVGAIVAAGVMYAYNNRIIIERVFQEKKMGLYKLVDLLVP